MNATVWNDGNDGLGAFAAIPSVRGSGLRMSPAESATNPGQDSPESIIGKTTEGQRDCLRLVYNHMTSKDIARVLNVSPHTVDMRLRTAMKALGVTGRIDAARLAVWAEQTLGLLPEGYQPLIYASPEMETLAESVTLDATVSAAGAAKDGIDPSLPTAHQLLRPDVGPSISGPPREIGASDNSEAAMLGSRSGTFARDTSHLDFGSGSRPLPGALSAAGAQAPSVPLPWGPRNNMAVPARLAWVAGIAIGSALSFGAVLSALQALKSLL